MFSSPAETGVTSFSAPNQTRICPQQVISFKSSFFLVGLGNSRYDTLLYALLFLLPLRAAGTRVRPRKTTVAGPSRTTTFKKETLQGLSAPPPSHNHNHRYHLPYHPGLQKNSTAVRKELSVCSRTPRPTSVCYHGPDRPEKHKKHVDSFLLVLLSVIMSAIIRPMPHVWYHVPGATSC